MLKKTLLAAALCILAPIVRAQDFEAPSYVRLETAADYARHEKDIIQCIDWLEQTAVNQDPGKEEAQKEAKSFFMQWLAGSPDVTIEVNTDIINFMEKNPDLMFPFMGGWTKLALEHPEYKNDQVQGNLAGLKSVIRVYQRGQGIKKDKKVEQFIKLDENGTLEQWIKDQLEKLQNKQ